MINDQWEEHIVGKTKEQLLEIMNKNPDAQEENVYIFVLSKYFFGIFKKRLYAFMKNDIVYDYFIGL